MKFVLAIILLALLGGLLWSLWFVLTNPRRRARQIAAKLSAPVVRTSEPFVVRYRRWTNGAAALFLALLLANVVTRTHDAAAIVMTLAIVAPVAVCLGWLAISSKPVLVITGEGIITRRPQRRLRWDDVETIAIEEGRGYSGVETYSLVLHLAPESVEPPERHLDGLVTTENETITTPLSLVSPKWPSIARAIHERSGRRPVLPSRYMARERSEAYIEPA